MRLLFFYLLTGLTCCTHYATIQIHLEVPEYTNSVTITGNLEELGNWAPASVPMDSLDPRAL